jgi:hypothetical protein
MSSGLTYRECLDEAARYRRYAAHMRGQSLGVASAIDRFAMLRGAAHQDALQDAMEQEASLNEN